MFPAALYLLAIWGPLTLKEEEYSASFDYLWFHFYLLYWSLHTEHPNFTLIYTGFAALHQVIPLDTCCYAGLMTPDQDYRNHSGQDHNGTNTRTLHAKYT